MQKVGSTIPQIDRIYSRSKSQGNEEERLVKAGVAGGLGILLALDRSRRIVLSFKEFCKRPSIDLRCIERCDQEAQSGLAETKPFEEVFRVVCANCDL